jgi:hypothetical protein
MKLKSLAPYLLAPLFLLPSKLEAEKSNGILVLPFGFIPRDKQENVSFFLASYYHIYDKSYSLDIGTSSRIPYVKSDKFGMSFRAILNLNTNLDSYAEFIKTQKKYIKRAGNNYNKLLVDLNTLKDQLRAANEIGKSEDIARIEQDVLSIQNEINDLVNVKGNLGDILNTDIYYRLGEDINHINDIAASNQLDTTGSSSGLEARINNRSLAIIDNLNIVSNNLINFDLDPFYLRTKWNFRIELYYYFDKPAKVPEFPIFSEKPRKKDDK